MKVFGGEFDQGEWPSGVGGRLKAWRWLGQPIKAAGSSADQQQNRGRWLSQVVAVLLSCGWTVRWATVVFWWPEMAGGNRDEAIIATAIG